MNEKTKQILLKLIGDMQDLRATVGALAAHPSMRVSLADAEDARNRAMQQDQWRYDELRKEIES